jgi:hypothetical protein
MEASGSASTRRIRLAADSSPIGTTEVKGGKQSRRSAPLTEGSRPTFGRVNRPGFDGGSGLQEIQAGSLLRIGRRRPSFWRCVLYRLDDAVRRFGAR